MSTFLTALHWYMETAFSFLVKIFLDKGASKFAQAIRGSQREDIDHPSPQNETNPSFLYQNFT